jgi:hypothetical protein
VLFVTRPLPTKTTTATATTATKRKNSFATPDNGRLDDDVDDDDDDNDDEKRNNKLGRQWNVMFEKLKAYKEMYGNCTVPNLYVCDDGTKLGRWVSKQRLMRVKDAALRA